MESLAVRSLRIGWLAITSCVSQPAAHEAPPSDARGATHTTEVTFDRTPAAPTSAQPQASADARARQEAVPHAATPPSDPPLATATTSTAAPTSTGTCTVQFKSVPAADIELDDVPLGITPRVAVGVTAGIKHRVIFRAPGVRSSGFYFVCRPAEGRVVDIDLRPASSRGPR